MKLLPYHWVFIYCSNFGGDDGLDTLEAPYTWTEVFYFQTVISSMLSILKTQQLQGALPWHTPPTHTHILFEAGQKALLLAHVIVGFISIEEISN